MINPLQWQTIYRQTVLIALIIINGCVLFAGVIFFLISKGPSSGSDVSLVRQITIILGLGCLWASFFVKERILRNNNDLTADQAVAKLKNAAIIAMALCEGAVFFGIVIAFMSQDLSDLLFPLIVGVIGFSSHFPRSSQWESYLQKNKAV